MAMSLSKLVGAMLHRLTFSHLLVEKKRARRGGILEEDSISLGEEDFLDGEGLKGSEGFGPFNLAVDGDAISIFVIILDADLRMIGGGEDLSQKGGKLRECWKGI